MSAASIKQLHPRRTGKKDRSATVFALPVSAPVFDYEDVPSPLSESESTITVLLRPALARGAPVR